MGLIFEKDYVKLYNILYSTKNIIIKCRKF